MSNAQAAYDKLTSQWLHAGRSFSPEVEAQLQVQLELLWETLPEEERRIVRVRSRKVLSTWDDDAQSERLASYLMGLIGPSAEELAAYAEKHRPPASWYEEDMDDL